MQECNKLVDEKMNNKDENCVDKHVLEIASMQ